MKKLLGLILVVGIGFTAVATEVKWVGKSTVKKISAKKDVGISFFQGSWSEALKFAKKEKKLIFLDAYASWCGPCKMMARNTFTKKEVGDFFNANFVNVKLDMEKDPDGRRLYTKYRLRAYPTLYFVDHKENIIHQELGYRKPKQLINIGKKVVKM